jgi:hypothetical protein
MYDGEDFVICRCEEVTLNDLRQGLRQGFNSPELLKRFSRLSMGMCQGRVCRPLYREFWEDLETTPTGDREPEEAFYASYRDSYASLPVSNFVDLPGSRPPVRPVSVDELAKLDWQDD